MGGDKMEWISFINYFRQLYQLQFKPLTKKYNINMIEVHILLFLKNNPNLNTAKDIVNYRGLAKSNVSNALDKLEHNGFITMKADEENRRIQRITLLKKSRPIVEKLKQQQLIFFSLIQKNFTKEELDMMEEFHKRMYENIISLIDTSKE